MKHLHHLTLCAAFMASPSFAQESKAEDGLNLIERGAQMFFRGLIEEVEPQLDDLAREMEPKLQELMEQMGPVFDQLSETIGSLDQFHPPEVLPNGDIILRRKQPKPVPDENEIDL